MATQSDPARRWLRDVIVTEATERSRRPTGVQARAPRTTAPRKGSLKQRR
jgi:hypothetical protein